MAYSLDVFNRFRGLGFNVIMADYPGYGMSDGSASESGCYATADAQYDYLLTRSDVDKGRMVSAGWSLGAAVAIDLASRRHVAGLATFSAFTNIADMSRSLLKGLPLVIPLSSRFDNLAKIGSVSVPVFMAHGTQDQLVPPEMLDQLAKSAKTAVTTVRVNGAAHNDIFQRGGNSLYQKVKAYVEGLSAVAPTTRQ
jgi:pimeloyl-ACP methyl ester carboxylesterase